MKTLFSTFSFLIIAISAGFAQQNPYETLKESLGAEQVNPSVLFPLEIEGVKVTDAKVDYRFPLEEGKSELILSMDDFKSLESAVFKFDVTDRAKLIEAFDEGTAKGFSVDFEKDGPVNFCRLISNENNPDEAYLLVGNEKQAEFLRIVYPKNSQKLPKTHSISKNQTRKHLKLNHYEKADFNLIPFCTCDRSTSSKQKHRSTQRQIQKQ